MPLIFGSRASTYENNLQEIMAYQSLLYPLHASGGYFGLAFATPPPPRVERLSTLMLSAEATLVSFTKFVGYLQWEVSFSQTEISLILKNKMAFL